MQLLNEDNHRNQLKHSIEQWMFFLKKCLYLMHGTTSVLYLYTFDFPHHHDYDADFDVSSQITIIYIAHLCSFGSNAEWTA